MRVLRAARDDGGPRGASGAGGRDGWLNTVASCAEDNHRKADRTPEEAGMPLLRQPFVPSPADAMLLAMAAGDRSELPEWLATGAAPAA